MDLSFKKSLRYDLPAGLVVFLVALPLCLGIALASGAPLFSGLIAGIIGGLVIPLVSRSALSVCGPAAGLTAIVLMGIEHLGTFEAFMLATFIAGLMQLGLGLLRAGGIGALVPSSVIKGMLAAIGLILILKQIPHAIGYDVESFGADAFFAPTGENTFSLFLHALSSLEWGAFIISAISLAILIVWPKTPLKKLTFLPPALVVVVAGTFINGMFANTAPNLALGESHLVQLPVMHGIGGFIEQLRAPDFSAIANPQVWTIALTIALVASIETLLCIEAVDKLDPYRRNTPTSRELVAQGVGNSISGLIGGLPITSVIVRSSANVASGGRTRMSAFFHGIFLFAAVVYLGQYLNMIPLACLAAILLQVGFKLARPALVRSMYGFGWDQFVPFATTVVAILFTDLLRGVIIGLVIGLVFVLRNKAHRAFTLVHEGDDNRYAIRFNKDVSFIHRPALKQVLRDIPDGAHVIIDGTGADYIDFDIKDTVQTFLESTEARKIEAEVHGIKFRANHEGEPVLQETRKVRTVDVEKGDPRSVAPVGPSQAPG